MQIYIDMNVIKSETISFWHNVNSGIKEKGKTHLVWNHNIVQYFPISVSYH